MLKLCQETEECGKEYEEYYEILYTYITVEINPMSVEIRRIGIEYISKIIV